MEASITLRETNDFPHELEAPHVWVVDGTETQDGAEELQHAPNLDPLSEEELQNLPPLANRRGADTFKEGQFVLFLVDEDLVVATVKSAKAYDSPLTLGPPLPISQEEIAVREDLIRKRIEELEREGGEPRLMPDPELLRLRISLCPEFSQVVQNPSPGFLHLMTKPGDPGVIIDMHHNYIIPMDAWSIIKENPRYLETWLANGSEESAAKRETLAAAIEELIDFENSSGQTLAGVDSNGSTERKRARARKEVLRMAKLSATRFDRFDS